MPNAHNDTTNARKSRKTIFVFGAVAVMLLMAGAFMAPSLMGSNDLTGSGNGSESLYGDPDAEIARAIAEMNAIADGAARAMADAGAAAEAEFNTSADAAADVVAITGAEGEAAVDEVANATGVLETAPESYIEGVTNVTVDGVSSSDISSASNYAQADYEYKVPQSVEEWERQNSSARGKLALGVPLTGNPAVDGHLIAVVSAYVDVKGNISILGEGLNNEENGIVIWNDDLGMFTAQGENVSHEGAPDWRAAEDAYAEGQMFADKGYSAASSLWSGINATVETQAELYATVNASVNLILEAQAEAEGEIQAEFEARQKATFDASAEAQAEAHAEAERKIELAHEAHAAAKQKLSAETEAQVQAVYSKSAEAAQNLELQAAAALEHGDAVAAQIHAQAEATIALLAEIETNTGTDMSAQASAVAKAAASAEAAARAKAKATADALVRQAAMVRAAADVKAQAVIKMSATLEASLDAKLSAAVKATLRAEAYTVAKIQARAHAELEAHEKAAFRAMFRVKAAAAGQAHLIIDAALRANAQAKINIDGSRDPLQMVRHDVTAGMTRDIDIIRDVAADYERQGQYTQDHQKATEYNNKATELEQDMNVIGGMTYLAESDIDPAYKAVVLTGQDIEALGQKFL